MPLPDAFSFQSLPIGENVPLASVLYLVSATVSPPGIWDSQQDKPGNTVRLWRMCSLLFLGVTHWFVARNLFLVALCSIKPHFILQIRYSHPEVAENPSDMLPASGPALPPHPLFLSPWPHGRKPLCEVLIWNNFSTLVFVFCWITGQRAYLWRSFLFYFFAVHSSN